MPGSSLWLLPPKSHPLHSILTSLIITTLPSLFPDIIIPPSSENDSDLYGMDSSFFPPHMTITSGISPSLYGSDPQGWLDSLPFPAADDPNHVKVRFHASANRPGDGDGVGNVKGSIQSQETFFRRCFIKVLLDGSIRKLAGIARAKAVNGEDAETGPKTQEWLATWEKEFGPHVSLIYGNVPITKETLAKISEVVEQAGVDLGGPGNNEDTKRYNGWDGGVVWLVPTDRPVNQWKPIATREL